MSASCSSRVRLEVKNTSGGRAAAIVPSSGMVTWKSESSSSRNASNSSSARSISSISTTTVVFRPGVERLEQRTPQAEIDARKAPPRQGRPRRRAAPAAAASSPSHRGRGGRRCPRDTAGGSGERPSPEPGRARPPSCRLLPRPRATAAAPAPRLGTPRAPAAGRPGSPGRPDAARAASADAMACGLTPRSGPGMASALSREPRCLLQRPTAQHPGEMALVFG